MIVSRWATVLFLDLYFFFFLICLVLGYICHCFIQTLRHVCLISSSHFCKWFNTADLLLVPWLRFSPPLPFSPMWSELAAALSRGHKYHLEKFFFPLCCSVPSPFLDPMFVCLFFVLSYFLPFFAEARLSVVFFYERVVRNLRVHFLSFTSRPCNHFFTGNTFSFRIWNLYLVFWNSVLLLRNPVLFWFYTLYAAYMVCF